MFVVLSKISPAYLLLPVFLPRLLFLMSWLMHSRTCWLFLWQLKSIFQLLRNWRRHWRTHKCLLLLPLLHRHLLPKVLQLQRLLHPRRNLKMEWDLSLWLINIFIEDTDGGYYESSARLAIVNAPSNVSFAAMNPELMHKYTSCNPNNSDNTASRNPRHSSGKLFLFAYGSSFELGTACIIQRVEMTFWKQNVFNRNSKFSL